MRCPWLALVRFVLLLLSVDAGAAAETLRRFSLKAGEAEETLVLFGQQAGAQVIFSPGAVAGVRTPSIKGFLTPADALARLLAGTPLTILRDPSGGLAVTRMSPEAVTEKASGPVLPTGTPHPQGTDNKTEQNMGTLPSSQTAARGFRRLLAGFGALLAGTAPGQTTTDDAVVVLDPFIVVSKSVDRANTVLNPSVQATISPASSVVDLLQPLPGVLVIQGDPFGGDDYSTRIFLRGFQAPQLGFALDGVPNGATNYGGGTKPNRFVDPENLALVTVSQGSSDIASPGGQGLGGTIEYATHAPSERAGVFSAVSFGDHSLRRVFARFNTGVVGGSTRAYLSLSDQSHHRWMNTGGEAGVADRFHVDFKSLSTFAAGSLTARYSYDEIWEPNYDSVSLADFARNDRWDGLTGEWTGRPNVDENYVKGWNTIRTNHLGSVEAEFAPSTGLSLTVTPYWHHQSGSGGWLPPYLRMGWNADGQPTDRAQLAAVEARAYFQDASGKLIPVGDPARAPAGVTFHPIPSSKVYDIDAYPAELRPGAVPVQSYRTSTYLLDRYGTSASGTWELAEKHTLRFGTWVERLDRRPGRTWQKVLDTRIGWEASRSPYWQDFLQEVTTDTLMFYLEDTLALGALRLTGGLRYYTVDQSFRDRFNVRPNRALSFDSGLLPSAGLVYSFGKTAGEVFGSYTRNFKTIDDGVISSSDPLSSSLEPETADSIDLGYRLNGRVLSASVSAYLIRFDNRVLRVQPTTATGGIAYDVGAAGGYVNAGGLESKGVEAAFSARLVDGLSLRASYSLNRSTYTETIAQNGIVGGNKIVGSPGTMLASGLIFDNGRYLASFWGKHVGRRHGTLDNREVLGGHTTFDASLGCRAKLSSALDSVEFALRISNLFDKHYLSGPENETRRTAGTGLYFIGPPRTVSFTVSTEF